MVTKKEIADYLNVSRTVVSMVLNNSKNSTVSEKTKQRVIEAAEELGYKFDESLNKICFLLYNRKSDDPRYLSDLRHIEKYCSKKNYRIIFMNAKNNDKDFEKVKRFIKANEANGFIVTGDVDDKIIDLLKENETNFIVYGGTERDDINVLLPDSERIAYEAVNYMIGYGHRRIALFLGSLDLMIHRKVLEGYTKALSENNIELDKSLIQVNKEEDGYEIAKNMNILNIGYTAAFCTNTVIQFSALQWYKENGINVPGDLSLVGYGLSDLVKLSYPELTTLYFDYAKSAEILSNSIIDIINNKPPEENIIHFDDYKVNKGGTFASNLNI